MSALDPAKTERVLIGWGLEYLEHDEWPRVLAELEECVVPAPPQGIDRDALRRALVPVLCNASNYPGPVQVHILGRDMGPLVARAVSAVADALAHPDAGVILTEAERVNAAAAVRYFLGRAQYGEADATEMAALAERLGVGA